MLKVGDKVIILTDSEAWKSFYKGANSSNYTGNWQNKVGVVEKLGAIYRGKPAVEVHEEGKELSWDYMPIEALAPASSREFHGKQVKTWIYPSSEKNTYGVATATTYRADGTLSPYRYCVTESCGSIYLRDANELDLAEEPGPASLPLTFAKDDAKNTIEAAKPSGWSFSATRESIDVERIGREAKEAGFDWVEISWNGKTLGVSVTEEILSDMENYAGENLRKSKTGQSGYVVVADTREDFEKLRTAYLKAKNKKYQVKVEGGKM